jgi:hypothetical protein
MDSTFCLQERFTYFCWNENFWKNFIRIMILVTTSESQINFQTVDVSVLRFNITERP